MNRWIWIRTLLTGMIALGFIALENVVGSRFIILITLFIMLMLLPFIRSMLADKFKGPSLIIDVMILVMMSRLSRFVINYYVYMLLMILLLEVGLLVKDKWQKIIGALIVGVTLYNYGVLFYYRQNLGTLSEIVFMLVIHILIVFSLILINQNKKEKEIQKDLNEQLESLTRLAVKNKLARDIHDTFGHDMMALIMELEMASLLIDSEPDQAKDMIIKAKSSARQGMKTIRQVVETLRNEDDMIREDIHVMIDRFRDRVNIEVNYKLPDEIEDKNCFEVLYRLIQECMTNSIRHGGADKIDIQVKEGLGMYSFEISDNGQGVGTINEGYGLKGMRERIEALNGKVDISGQDGFTVKGYIEVKND
ncbi:sensor histidine kinase [Acidaminobacter sp. JC074]|uniref:sensor histidine kinase n=1 Tax=Acidaminobacter sp. JC074 TaxID=2530199 RepID=UPI001F0E9C66|nr:sensor histidine kinase [Acidaminobacter sp. JC074]MCH4889898.1 sensor histidine kinase [Acidaminobacter sp. JC074]